MMPDRASPAIVVGVGAVIWNGEGGVLLIRRANPPRQNEWSLPGGRLEFGERLRDALAREVREETGLEIEILGLIDVIELAGSADGGQPHYVLVDFSARFVSGEAVAASDALEARWVTLNEIDSYGLWSETRRVIALSAEQMKRV